MMQKLRAWISRHYHALMQIRDTPHAIAGGLAAGIFIGFLPLVLPFVPVKTLLAILLAWLFRCSKLSAAVGVTCHDVVLPIWPLVLRWQYQIGYWLLSRPHQFPPKIPKLKHFSMEHWLHWRTLKELRVLWPPTFLGALVLAIPLALIFYFVALQIITRYQARRKQHEPQTYS